MAQSGSRGKVGRFLRASFHEKLNALEVLYFRVKAAVYYRHIFRSFGKGSILYTPMLLSHPEYIRIGRGVSIRQGVRLEAIVSDPTQPPELIIGDNVNIEQNAHIVCHSRVVIGNDVSITGHCTIVDVTHPYEDVDDPRKIGDRVRPDRSYVEIGDRSFLGYAVTVLPNVHIGRYCVIGANALVTRDVPDYSVAAGCPAVLFRQYNHEDGKWHTLNGVPAAKDVRADGSDEPVPR